MTRRFEVRDDGDPEADLHGAGFLGIKLKAEAVLEMAHLQNYSF